MGTQLSLLARMQPFLFPLIAALGSVEIVKPDVPIAPVAPVITVPLGDIAQRAAQVAVQHAGLAADDGEVDRMATRARMSALLPEVRLRALETSAGPRDYISDTGAISTTNYLTPTYTIEGDLVFHFERLAYSGQEARLERLRLERIEARSRITQRVIEELSRWARATSDEHDSAEGTDAHGEARARRVNAQMALDVWTGGWFSRELSSRI